MNKIKAPTRMVENAIKFAEEVRAKADSDENMGILYAAEHILADGVENPPDGITLTENAAKSIVQQFVQHLLEKDHFEAAATILWGSDVYDWRPKSSRDTWRCLFDYDKVLVQGAGAMGKCLAKGTPVIMADGSVRKIETIKQDEFVMGADSKPRRVLETHFGTSPMYKVKQERGDSYIVNENHILTLVCTQNKKNGDKKTTSSTYTRGKMIDIPIKEYIQKSDQFKKFYKGAYTGVSFNEQDVSIEPYIYGLWLGDGGSKCDYPTFTSMDDSNVSAWNEYWESRGGRIYKNEKAGNKASTYVVRQLGMTEKLFGFSMINREKIVSETYKINSKQVRENVLAGFLDTDGYIAGVGYGFIQKNKQVADGIVFIARSLGFTATLTECRKECVNNGVWGKYYRGHISGDCTTIPCRLKPAPKRKQRVSIGQKINVIPIGNQEYYGFSLDGDHRFLLGDFTITHNSFGAAAWFYLDWYRDPFYTNIKVISLTREHAERNIFASIKNFHRTALVKPEWDRTDELVTSIQANSDNKQGIHLVAIPKGESGHGTLRGFHPTPRFGAANKKWGRLSRTHVILDEAEEVPAGVWEGINNIISTTDSDGHKGHIKIFGASNPKDRTSDFGQRCEPMDGWGLIDCEENFEWESREGFHVLRLDAAQCENVVEKRVVYAGLQTYQGFMGYMSRGRTAEAMTMARGWFPEEGQAMGIITPAMMDNALGQVRFIGPVVALAAFDLALEGNDQVVCSYGRFGLSDGWTPQSGQFIDFKSPRIVLQLDSQIPFPKKATLEQTQAIIRFAKQMRISPNWLCVDRTGNGSGIHDSLCTLYGNEVLGVNYSWAATNTHILGEDSQLASELYNGVVTELLFGLSKYLEFDYLKISPSFRNEELIRQATGRRYKQKGKGMVRVESKQDYCKRTRSKSPDALDSLSLLVFLMRQRGGASATMTEPKAQPNVDDRLKSIVDNMEFVDFSD